MCEYIKSTLPEGSITIKSYKTIYQQTKNEIIEKKSRFIGTAVPVNSKDEAEAKIKDLQKLYKDATHNCFAYRVIEGNQIIERQNDDGEPSGTAGMPILTVLRGEELLNVAIVVTRYYGGILLGTGGLNRAYGGGAKASITGVIQKDRYHMYSIKLDYTLHGSIAYELTKTKAIVKDTVFTENVEVIVYITEEESEGFIKNIIELSQGKAEINLVKTAYGFFYEDNFYEE